MNKDKIRYLVEQYMVRQLTEDQMDELLALTETPNEAALQAVIKELMEEYSARTEPVDTANRQISLQKVLNVDKAQSGTHSIGRLINFSRYWKVAAAAVIVLIGSGTYFIINRTNEKPIIAAFHYKGDVQPGHNGAILHLSNGNTVVLDSAQDGTVATQGTIQAVKVNGELKYVGKTSEVLYNTVSTDRGRQWQLTLPDGTKVWLNSASSIRYPLSFPGNERVVEITGEAYMEVVHNVRQVFKVKVGNQVIEDIGTSFNINAYGDEPAITTTLLEGSIKVSAHGNTQLVKPGQQTIVLNIGASIGLNSNVNLENVIAWKNGFFAFQDADIKAVMHQLSRWYNVDVKYEGNISKEEFNGKIGQGLTLAQVLKILEKTGVHFKIEEDKRIVILP
jgi:ferric-dicitrate binding protein FerR (iron transport regulator)